jgi:hypothetical protein
MITRLIVTWLMCSALIYSIAASDPAPLTHEQKPAVASTSLTVRTPARLIAGERRCANPVFNARSLWTLISRADSPGSRDYVMAPSDVELPTVGQCTTLMASK